MALIPQYHVVADMYPVDPATNPDIVEGMWVMLDSDGFAVKAAGGAATYAIGIAGDSSEASTGHRPYSADLIIGAAVRTGSDPEDVAAQARSTDNRVSDYFNHTAASGKITVYAGGGKFSTDQYVTARAASINPGDPLYVSTGALLTDQASTNKQVVGICTITPSAYDSGVPGTETLNGSMSLGSYVTFQMANFLTA